MHAPSVHVWNEDGQYRDVEDVLRSAAFERDSGDVLRACLQQVVWGPSITQAAKGILSAGIVKTFVYTLAKVKKAMKSKKIVSDFEIEREKTSSH